MSDVGACPKPRSVLGPEGWAKYRCRSRRCPSCGILWAGDARRKLLSNIEHYGGDVALVTVTAPGSDRLPTTRAMVDWNLSAPGRWRRLHTAARSASVRAGHRVTLVSRTWEYQKRGALHVHVVLGVKTARELAGAHEYASQLARLRGLHDFGFVDRGRRVGTRRMLEIIPAQRAARYVAKYLSPLDREGKPTLSQTVLRRDVPPHVMHVQRELTQATGVTMRSLRRRRMWFCRGVDPDTGEIFRPAGAVAIPHDLALVLVRASQHTSSGLVTRPARTS